MIFEGEFSFKMIWDEGFYLKMSIEKEKGAEIEHLSVETTQNKSCQEVFSLTQAEIT